MTPFFEDIEVYETVASLDPSEPRGTVALVLNPLTLYVYTDSGYQVLSSGSNPPAPSGPASTPASRR
jgi:hypothetical protein